MKDINEQWIQISRRDNNLHMLKAVESYNHNDYICIGCDMACDFYSEEPRAFCNAGDEIMYQCNCGAYFRIKDLGIVDENGCLPEERTGMYPDIEYIPPDDIHTKGVWFISLDDEVDDIHVIVYGDTKEEALFKWNKRN